MPATGICFWTSAPFVRLLPPLIAGILVQWYQPFPIFLLLAVFCICAFLLLLYCILPVGPRYRFRTGNGMLTHCLLAALGAGLVWNADVRNDARHFSRVFREGCYLRANLAEAPVEKQASFKAVATVCSVIKGDSSYPARGKVLIYFGKGAALPPAAGAQILFKKAPEEIRSSGNPGSFDYRQYQLFGGLMRQVFLAPGEFVVLPGEKQPLLDRWLAQSRLQVVAVLQKYISGHRERGLAEALLIGYKANLDKSLVQAYAHTGVVHIIAISGLHLGLIYGLLRLLTRPLKRRKAGWPLRLALIVAGLWLFSLLAGGGPSVLRSALMFTCIALGEAMGRRAVTLNTLAFSAFVLLCYHPFWLWDAGFQLSYAAVGSILVFYRPVYLWVYLPNKALDALWKGNAVTIAAQVFTLPVCLYHFHQFPVLFLLANFVAVPLSFIILAGALLLCTFSFWEPAAGALGFLVQEMIRWLNSYVERMDTVSFGLWEGLSVSLPQCVLLTGMLAGAAVWLMERQKMGFWLALACLSAFACLRSLSFARAYRQQKLIVYNVPRCRAIDVLEGRQAWFIGDATLLRAGFARDFHLKPSRVLHRVAQAVPVPAPAAAFTFGGKKILLVDTGLHLLRLPRRLPVDVLIISGAPVVRLPELSRTFAPGQVVIDASVPRWAAGRWQRDCDSLKVPCHNVAENGAFELTVQ